MDVKETLTRWSRAYMEPSLFYVPVKKNNDEYYTVNLIPKFNYFSVFEETVRTDVTYLDWYKETQENAAQNRYGGIYPTFEGVYYIAYDENGEIADCSIMKPFFSIAEKTTLTEKINGYTVENYTYRNVKWLFNSSNNCISKIDVIKSIPTLSVAETLFKSGETQYGTNIYASYHPYYTAGMANVFGEGTLFILNNGDIYVWMVDTANIRNSPWTYTNKKVGKYDYNTDKFNFSDIDFYKDLILIGGYSNIYNCGSNIVGAAMYGHSIDDYNLPDTLRYPYLRLKKGKYTIVQINSGAGSRLAQNIEITVDGDMVVNPYVTLDGVVIRCYQSITSNPYVILSDYPETQSKNKWDIHCGSFGSFQTETMTYSLSDYSLKIHQKISDSSTGGIYFQSNDGTRVNYYAGNSIMFTYTSPTFRPSEVTGLYLDSIIYKRAFTKSELKAIKEKSKDFTISDSGTGGTVLSYQLNYADHYGTYYPAFTVYYDMIKKQDEYGNYDVPDVVDWANIEATIESISIEEWFTDEKNTSSYSYYDEESGRWLGGGKRIIGSQSKYTRICASAIINGHTYSISRGNFLTNYAYTDTRSGQNEQSLVNRVTEYWRADDIDDTDITNYVESSYKNICSTNYPQNDGPNNVGNEYRNYFTCLNEHVEIKDDWNEEEHNKVFNTMAQKLFEEQLK
nr:MAG TPA: hypothetical protein [Caudoviricetes sp.]